MYPYKGKDFEVLEGDILTKAMKLDKSNKKTQRMCDVFDCNSKDVLKPTTRGATKRNKFFPESNSDDLRSNKSK